MTERPTSARRSRPGLSIGELMSRTGVTRATVHHYADLGLLPLAARPNRRMAYYDPACVERIELIQDLQSKRFLPLSVIKRILDHLRKREKVASPLAKNDPLVLSRIDPGDRVVIVRRRRTRSPQLCLGTTIRATARQASRQSP